METVISPQHMQIHNQSFNSTVPTVIQVVYENGDSVEDAPDSQKSKMAFSGRPQYQSESRCTTHMTTSFNDKMCINVRNDLSSDAPAIVKIEEDQTEREIVPDFPSVPPSIVQTSSGHYIAISPDGAIQFANPGTDGMQGRQTVTLANSGMPLPGASILQYTTESGDMAHQFFMPGSKMVVQAATGDMSAYQICRPTSSLPQGVMMAGSPPPLYSPQQLADEATRKRELRLFKNREAARECRRKKKEYVKCLENRVAVLENQNKTLIEELKALKDLYCRKAE